MEPTHTPTRTPIVRPAHAQAATAHAYCWRCQTERPMHASLLVPGTWYCHECGYAAQPPSGSLR